MSKEKIYTIPVTDAYRHAVDCPICYMYEELERHKIDFLFDTAYMENDIRLETNKLGFCEKHYVMIDHETNRLGIALILQTHMKSVHDQLLKKTKSILSGKKGFMNKKENGNSNINQFIQDTYNKCYICETVEVTFNMYLDTLLYLYKKDSDFQKLFMDHDFYCMKHFGILYDLGANHLKGPDKEQFLSTLTAVYENSMTTILEDLDWFVKKFDYRYTKEPWNNAKTAIPRALRQISSINTTK